MAEEGRQRAARIAALNDAFRRTGQGGTVLATRGVIAKGEAFVALALAQVRAFSTFTADNDPYGEHDFGAFTLEGARVYWKVDYYDETRSFGSSDPANPAVTHRVLTVLLAEEY